MHRHRLGLIGIGLVGQAIAERMLQAGWEVVGYDIAPQRREILRRLGGIAVEQAREVVNSAARVVLSLPDSEIVAQVLGALHGDIVPGTVLIDTTTGAPRSAETLAEEWTQRNVDYCDATILGSSEMVRCGTAMVLVGGNERQFSIVDSVVRPWAGDVLLVGPVGSGTRMKLVVNLALGLHRAVLAEALGMAEAIGIDAEQALRVLEMGSASSAVMPLKGPKMLRGDFRPQARLSQHLKDVGLILALGGSQQAKLPLTELHQSLLEECVRRGWGDLDNSAIFKLFQQKLPGTSRESLSNPPPGPH